MHIYLILLAALTLMVVLIRKHIPIGPSILAGGLLVWVIVDHRPIALFDALKQTLTLPRTYDLFFALYFVVCLEIELRKSNAIKGLIDYLHHLIPSTKVTLAVMPMILGLLPSIGGARFSSPIVENLCEGQTVDSERKAAINYWFRHIMEFSNPIVPGILLACSICGITVGDLILHLLWVSIAMFAVGWLVILHPLNIVESDIEKKTAIDIRRARTDALLALVPICIVFVLCVNFKLPASISIAVVVAGLYPILRWMGRAVSLKEIFVDAVEKKLFRDVGLILYFIQLLTVTGTLTLVVHSFDASPLPLPVIFAFVSFIVGMLTGLSQGHVPMMMPIVAAVVPQGEIQLIGLTLFFGVMGQMVTPTHVCLMVSLDYFKADFFKTLRLCAIPTAILVALFCLVSLCLWH